MTLFYFLAVLSAVFTAIGQVLLKKYSNKKAKHEIKSVFNIYLALSVIFFMGSFFLAIYSMQVLDFSVYYTFTALNFVFISFLSSKYLDETLDMHKIAGVLIIVSGIVVFNL